MDIFVAGVGTGGTITGVGRYLKEQNSDIKIVAVEPDTSPVLSEGIAGGHVIQGIGAGFVPETLDIEILDQICTVSGEEAYQTCRELVQTEGILCGVSSGAALCVARKLAQKEENMGKTIVVLLPDNGERYLSVGVY